MTFQKHSDTAEAGKPWALIREYKYEEGCEDKIFCFHCKGEVEMSHMDRTFYCPTCNVRISAHICKELHSGKPSDVARGVNMRKVIFYPKP